MKISVKNLLNHKTKSLDVDPSNTIGTVKSKLLKKDETCLMFIGNKLLKNEWTLNSSHVDTDEVLCLGTLNHYIQRKLTGKLQSIQDNLPEFVLIDAERFVQQWKDLLASQNYKVSR